MKRCIILYLLVLAHMVAMLVCGGFDRTIHCSFALDAQRQSDTFQYDDHGNRDPFTVPRRSVTEAGGEVNDIARVVTGLDVQGIIWDQGKPVVLIDGLIYQEQDYVSDIMIRRIAKDRVLFERNGNTYEKTIKEGE